MRKKKRVQKPLAPLPYLFIQYTHSVQQKEKGAQSAPFNAFPGVLQIRDRLIVIVQPYLEPYLGGDSFEAVRIGGFDKRCGV